MPEERVKDLPIIHDKKTGSPLWLGVRELSLRYAIPIGAIGRFFEGLREGKLLATRCGRCGAKYFPPQADCPNCGAGEVEWFEVSGRGRLLTYTVINVKPESYSKHPDYAVGVARLEEGFNVVAWINCEDYRKLRRGMPVRVEVRRREEEGLLTYYIVPAEG